LEDLPQVNLKRSLIRRLLPVPVHVRHAEYSMIFSADDEKAQPAGELMSIALEAVNHARSVSLADIITRMKTPPYYPEVWPGEHYKLLAGLVLTVRPATIIEIGSATGLSALAMKKYLPQKGKVVTFDIVQWKMFAETCLVDADFEDGRLIQKTEDLSDPAVVLRHRELLGDADMIFIDAAKDGIMEQRFLDNFRLIAFKKNPLLIFDDIRVWNMLRIWREIPMPKLDLTSFGHWSGTGIVQWQ
jgi:predicted O-methyltransferase YrrM